MILRQAESATHMHNTQLHLGPTGLNRVPQRSAPGIKPIEAVKVPFGKIRVWFSVHGKACRLQLDSMSLRHITSKASVATSDEMSWGLRDLGHLLVDLNDALPYCDSRINHFKLGHNDVSTACNCAAPKRLALETSLFNMVG